MSIASHPAPSLRREAPTTSPAPEGLTRRTFTGLGAALAASALAAGAGIPSSLARASEAATSSGADAAPSPVDDFYEAVNHDTLASWEIPAGESRVSTFTNLRDNVRDVLDDLIRTAATSPDLDDPDLRTVGALYATGTDAETRDANGFGTVTESCLRAIEQAQTPTELLSCTLDAALQAGSLSLLRFNVDQNPHDATKRCLSLWTPDLGPEREVLLSEDEALRRVVDAYEGFVARLWEIRGAGSEEARAIAADVVGLMREVAPSSLSVAQQHDPSATTNLLTPGELSELLGGALDVAYFCEATGADPDAQLNVCDVGGLRAMASHLTDEGLPLLKRYAQTVLLVDTASYASTEAEAAKREYLMVSDGLTEAPEAERDLLNTIEETLAKHECSRLFCSARFPEAARQDVADMAGDIVDVFARRIQGLDWMGPDTKERALKKLDTLKVRAGYPDTWPQYFYDDEARPSFPEEGGVFADNAARLGAAAVRNDLALLTDESREFEWSPTPATVNAFYEQSGNSITILAGILQPPIYDVTAPREQNLGSIGSTIAHEISHAFDANGAQYDELGNVNNWWTEADYAHFRELAEHMAAYYDGFSVNGRQIHGEQTLSENIADLAGMSCVTQIAVEEGLDLGALFEAYGRQWATKGTDAWLADQVATDVHSPAKVRVNAVLSALDEFYETFGVTEGDGMWQDPESRPKIW